MVILRKFWNFFKKVLPRAGSNAPWLSQRGEHVFPPGGPEKIPGAKDRRCPPTGYVADTLIYNRVNLE